MIVIGGKNLESRKKAEDQIDKIISEWTFGLDHLQAQATLQDAKIPAGVVQNAQEVTEDSHLSQRGYFVNLDHVEAGARIYDGTGWKMSQTPIGMEKAAPLLGEHTFDVCTTILELPPEEIAELVAEQVLF